MILTREVLFFNSSIDLVGYADTSNASKAVPRLDLVHIAPNFGRRRRSNDSLDFTNHDQTSAVQRGNRRSGVISSVSGSLSLGEFIPWGNVYLSWTGFWLFFYSLHIFLGLLKLLKPEGIPILPDPPGRDRNERILYYLDRRFVGFRWWPNFTAVLLSCLITKK